MVALNDRPNIFVSDPAQAGIPAVLQDPIARQRRSVFADYAKSLYAVYAVELAVRDRLVGGTPRNPKVIEGWLGKVIGRDQEEEIRRATLRTLVENGAELPENATEMSLAQLDEALASVAGEKQTVGFKQDATGIYLESRCAKAMLKESNSVLFTGEKRGQRDGYGGKAAKSFFPERVFLEPSRLYFRDEATGAYLREPSGIELFIGHPTGPQGKTSNLTYFEYVSGVTLAFELWVLLDAVPHDDWPQLFVHAELNGLGAMRSQGFGTFEVLRFERINEPKLPKRATKAKE